MKDFYCPNCLSKYSFTSEEEVKKIDTFTCKYCKKAIKGKDLLNEEKKEALERSQLYFHEFCYSLSFLNTIFAIVMAICFKNWSYLYLFFASFGISTIGYFAHRAYNIENYLKEINKNI